MVARLRKLVRRAREDAGFGMVELLCAMGVLSIGILAVFSMFQSGMVQIKRASTVSTAAALADSEMEGFRALEFRALGLPNADGNSVPDGADSAYTGLAPPYKPVLSPSTQANSTVVVAACPATPCTTTVPTRTATGADGKSYRIDTYVTWQSVQSQNGTPGRIVKLITIVVRDPSTLRVHARVSSSFDESTGL